MQDLDILKNKSNIQKKLINIIEMNSIKELKTEEQILEDTDIFFSK
jgi:hypothetical protein